jgi:diketogulonate reductase-like aldo/keto reductase
MTNDIRACTTLNNGIEMPWLGFGVFGIDDGDDVENAVRIALDVGYRSIDTASIYMNESGVGKAIRESGLPRDEIFLTTKVWNDDQRSRRTLAAFEDSLDRLKSDYVDLYLVHWPVEGFFQETWAELERIYRSGRARAIGVSNFLHHHLTELLATCEIVPSVNQIEFHPRLVQPALLEYCQSQKVQVEAWSPLMQGQVDTEPAIVGLAEKYAKTPAQIVLRWDLQHRVVTIPKSSRANRISENTRIFDFELSEEDMLRLDALDEGRHLGPDPKFFDF